MTLRPVSIAVGLAALATAAIVGSPAANAVPVVPHPTAVEIMPVSCLLNNAWLRLFTTTGEHCFSGNGSIAVNLVVERETIVGQHTVCLTIVTPRGVLCEPGPATVQFKPALHVIGVEISTP